MTTDPPTDRQDPSVARLVRFTPAPLTPLTGSERFTGLDAAVADFWSFAMPDLRTNNVRGYLAEFLVARAVRAAGPRVEWNSYDVVTPTGLRIEVKSTARLQVWEQARHSSLRFTGLRARPWTQQSNYGQHGLNAEAYVFAVQTARSHDEYDPLRVAAWDFYVLPAAVLEVIDQDSVSLSTVQSWASAVKFCDLGAEVERSVGRSRTLAAAASRAIEDLLPGSPVHSYLSEHGGNSVLALEGLLIDRVRAHLPVAQVCLEEVDEWLAGCSADEAYGLDTLIAARLAVGPGGRHLHRIDLATYRGVYWAVEELGRHGRGPTKGNAHLIRAARFLRLRDEELEGPRLLTWLHQRGY